jgi:hypothetical protein
MPGSPVGRADVAGGGAGARQARRGSPRRPEPSVRERGAGGGAQAPQPVARARRPRLGGRGAAPPQLVRPPAMARDTQAAKIAPVVRPSRAASGRRGGDLARRFAAVLAFRVRAHVAALAADSSSARRVQNSAEGHPRRRDRLRRGRAGERHLVVTHLVDVVYERPRRSRGTRGCGGSRTGVSLPPSHSMRTMC